MPAQDAERRYPCWAPLLAGGPVMTSYGGWWERLSDVDQQTLLAHRARFFLPAEVIAVYEASGGPPAEPVDGRLGRYRWPASTRDFLFDQAASDPDCE